MAPLKSRSLRRKFGRRQLTKVFAMEKASLAAAARSTESSYELSVAAGVEAMSLTSRGSHEWPARNAFGRWQCTRCARNGFGRG